LIQTNTYFRNLFRDHFAHDLDEREYGDYNSMEDLIIKALPDIARLDTLPQAGSDMLILPTTTTEKQPNQIPTSTTPNASTNTPTTSTQNTSTSAETTSPPSPPIDSHEHDLAELKPKLETDPNVPKLVSFILCKFGHQF
jgi:hypothetical protein